MTGWKLYVIRRADTKEVKIGISQNPQRRLHDFQSCHARPLELLVVTQAYRTSEANAFERFKAHRISGEWFHECPEILEWVRELNDKNARASDRRLAGRRASTAGA